MGLDWVGGLVGHVRNKTSHVLLNQLGVSREQGNILLIKPLYTTFPYSLLTPSKSKRFVFETLNPTP